jgi:hypothetical protein
MPATFIETLKDRPPELSPLARYITYNGIFYMIAGAGMFFAPKAMLELQFQTELHGYEVGLSNAVGMTLLVIGWFYVMGGRTGRASFALATIVDRAIVPFMLVSLWLRGLAPPLMVLPFAVLDPLLAIGAYVLWQRERAT